MHIQRAQGRPRWPPQPASSSIPNCAVKNGVFSSINTSRNQLTQKPKTTTNKRTTAERCVSSNTSAYAYRCSKCHYTPHAPLSHVQALCGKIHPLAQSATAILDNPQTQMHTHSTYLKIQRMRQPLWFMIHASSSPVGGNTQARPTSTGTTTLATTTSLSEHTKFRSTGTQEL